MEERQEIVRQELTPLVMLEKAVVSGADVAVLERLMALSERWQANKAMQAFSEALSSVRGDLPAIVKTRKVDFSTGKGRTQYRYEDLADVIEQVAPVLARYGLSFRWRTDSETPGAVKVTCILSHRDGHSEETALAGPCDVSGNKNPIQAIGSVVTYLQRYTLKAALGIAAGFDDDGRPGGQTSPGDEQEERQEERQASPKTIALIQKMCRSHHITDIERAGIDSRIANRMSQDGASRAIDWIRETVAKRAQAVEQSAQVPPAEQVPIDPDDLMGPPPGQKVQAEPIGDSGLLALTTAARNAAISIPALHAEMRRAWKAAHPETNVEALKFFPEDLVPGIMGWIDTFKQGG